MLKVKAGDLEKLGLLFERYKRPLYGFFYGVTKDRESAEDLVQTVFFRILKYRHLFRGDGDFKTWMFHIARNVGHDHYRKNKWRRDDTLDDWGDRLTSGENRANEFEHEEEKDLLWQAIDRLPEDKREILLLSKFQEMKYKEIGAVLGCSESAVKVKVFRALQDLKAVFRQLEKQS